MMPKRKIVFAELNDETCFDLNTVVNFAEKISITGITLMTDELGARDWLEVTYSDGDIVLYNADNINYMKVIDVQI